MDLPTLRELTAKRRAQLAGAMQAAGLDALLLSDRKNIYYYSGFAGDDSYLLLYPGAAYLLSDGRFIAQAAAEAPDAKFLCRASGQTLGELLLAALGEKPAKRLGFEGGNISYAAWAALTDLLGQKLPELEFTPAGDLPLAPRLIKDEYEQFCLRRCGEIADKALEATLPCIKPGATEREIAWQLEQALHEAGGQGISFATIVAAGPNSAKPHAIPSDYAIQPGDFVTLDFGCRWQNYCGDCTRTFAVGKISDEQKAAYAAVLAAQLAGLAQIRPGLTTGQADAISRAVIEAAGLGEYFSHSLGHGVGLNIHEAPALAPHGQVVLLPGHLVTVEPGVYLPERFGLRIEDSCLVTEDGLLPLTRFPKELITL